MNGFLLPQGFRRIVFPGVYGFPREAAARVAATTIGSHLEEQQLPEPVIFVCFETATFNAYCNAVGWEVRMSYGSDARVNRDVCLLNPL